MHSVQKSLADYGDKLEAAEKEAIEAAIKELQETLKGEDKDAIEAKTTALMTASQSWAKIVMPRRRPKRLPPVALLPVREGAAQPQQQAAGQTMTTSWTRKSRK